MDVLGADRDVGIALRERVADRGEADERRADDPDHARDPGPRRDRPGQVARVGRGRVHLPVGGHDDVTHQRIMPERAGPEPTGSASRVARRSRRSSARWTAERWISSRSASSARLASGVSRRASATSRTTYGCFARRPSASSVAIASSWRPAALTARWRFADSALRTRLSSPRRARETWRASSSSRAPAAPIRRRKVPDRLAVLRGHDAPPATQAPRDRQPELGQPGGELRRRGRLDDELEVGPAAGQAERATGQEPAAQPGGAAVVRGRSPSRTARPALPFPDRPSRCASRATDASRPVGAGPRPSTSATRSQARDGSMAASSSRSAVTRSRSDRVTRLPAAARRPATPAVTSGAPARRAAGRPAPDPGLALEGADDRRGEPGRVVVMGVGPGRRRRRG